MQTHAIQQILDKAVQALQAVPGMMGVVLGGSRARGTHTDSSDIDIGIYYDAQTLDLPALTAAAMALDDTHRPDLIAGPGGWGHWVDGGGWLTVDGYAVDFVLRDIHRVAQIIRDCQSGIVAAHYQAGHPHGFIDAMYMGELGISKLLWDRIGQITALKAEAEHYPPALGEKLIYLFSFETHFSLMLAERYATTDDVYYVTAHLVRSVSCLNQVLFALNGQYCINEKKAVAMIDGFAQRPENYPEKVQRIFTSSDMTTACQLLKALVDEVSSLR